MTVPRWIEQMEHQVFCRRGLWLILFLVLSLFFAWQASQLKVDAGFKKQLPLQHEYMKTFLQYEKEFGGANRLLVALMSREGDIFSADYFQQLEALTNDVFFLQGVNRASVRSIFTPNVRFVEIVEDGFAGGNVIPADFVPDKENFARVKANIIKSGELGRLVTDRFDGAMVWAELMEVDPVSGEKIDYQRVAAQLEELREKYENEQQSVHIIGFAKIVGDIAQGAKSVIGFFVVALLITFVLLLFYTHSFKLAVLPLVCSMVAVIWELGTLRLLGYGIDPMNMLTPFLIFAIGVSHGVQMINAWNTGMVHDDHGEGATWSHQAMQSARKTYRTLLVPGLIALASDTVGFMSLLLIDIRIIQELAITASIGVAVIILTNMKLLPILLSYTRISNLDAHKEKHRKRHIDSQALWRFLSVFSKPGVAAVTLMVMVLLFIGGQKLASETMIGDSQHGVPELRPEARYNRDAELISSRFALSVDVLTVIAETTANACTENYRVMETIDRFAWHLKNVEGVQKVITLPMVAKIINAGWNEGNIKWRVLSRNNYVMRQALANVETDTGLLNRDCSAMPILVFLNDHKADTINRLIAEIKEFRNEHTVPGVDFRMASPEEDNGKNLQLRLATGNVGVMAAMNEQVAEAQFPMLMYVYGVIVVLCLLTFRSLTATLCIVLPLSLVSVLAYALMTWMGIGLKVNTLPVVALGVGIGVDYGIYIYSRLNEFLKQGVSLQEAYFHTLQLTGKPVLFTGITLAVGVGTWLFSDLKFQADMGMLLGFMFLLNMLGAMLILPALARWLVRPSEKVTDTS